MIPLLLMLMSLAQALPAPTRKPANADIENIGIRDINKGSINFISLEKELAMGRELSAEVERNARMVDDAVVNEYIDQMGQRIAINSDIKIPVSFKVIDSDEPNASALPGGHVYINSGLIRIIDSEAELAFVLAYGVADIAARHGGENQSKGSLLNVTIPLIFLGGRAGLTFPQQSTSFAIPVAFFKFAQEAVRESDFLGIQYLHKAGYDPMAAISLFRTLEALEPDRKPSAFETHPAIPERIQALEKTIQTVLPALKNPNPANPEFIAVKGRLAKLRGDCCR